jgi:hypothetical protein
LLPPYQNGPYSFLEDDNVSIFVVEKKFNKIGIISPPFYDENARIAAGKLGK